MSVPKQEQNFVGSHVYPTTDLGIPVTLTGGQTVTGTQFSTGIPATLIVICQLVTGAGTLHVEVGAEGFTPGYSGGNDTAVTLTGTGVIGAVVNTAFVYDDSSILTTTISTDKRFVATEVINTNGGDILTFSKFAILVCYELTAGEDWFLGLRSSAWSMANKTVGDGTGLMSLNPDYTLNPYPGNTTRNPDELM